MITRSSTSAVNRLFFFLLAVYILSTLAAQSGYAQDKDYIKYVRLSILALCGVLALTWFRPVSPRTLTFSLLAFSMVFFVGVFWSPAPLYGLYYKGSFLASVIVGISSANSLRTSGDLTYALRSFVVGGYLLLALTITACLATSEPLFFHGRLYVLRINPNLVGQTTSMLALLCGFNALFETDARWRRSSFAMLIALLAVTILTGSRGALASVLLGLAVLAPTAKAQMRQLLPVLFIGSIAGVGMLLYSTGPADPFAGDFSVAGETEGLRLTSEFFKDTRSKVWRHCWRIFTNSPVIGVGWLTDGRKWNTVQSAYLQVIVETGVLGGVFLLLFFVRTFGTVTQLIRKLPVIDPSSRKLMVGVTALMAMLLAHGTFESTLVVGASPLPVLFGFSTSMLDRMHQHFVGRRL